MSLTRREWLKRAAVGGAGLAVGELLSIEEVQAATRTLKLANVKEYTTACNFCSVGCGMVGRTRNGELVNLEGDPDHVINGGSLCAKGSAMAAVHTSPERVRTPLYRAPGSDRWQEISWDEAIAKVARKIKDTRDASWIATEKDGDRDVPVNRTEAIGFLGGAQNTNEECYLIQKAARVFGTPIVEHQARL